MYIYLQLKKDYHLVALKTFCVSCEYVYFTVIKL